MDAGHLVIVGKADLHRPAEALPGGRSRDRVGLDVEPVRGAVAGIAAYDADADGVDSGEEGRVGWVGGGADTSDDVEEDAHEVGPLIGAVVPLSSAGEIDRRTEAHRGHGGRRDGDLGDGVETLNRRAGFDGEDVGLCARGDLAGRGARQDPGLARESSGRGDTDGLPLDAGAAVALDAVGGVAEHETVRLPAVEDGIVSDGQNAGDGGVGGVEAVLQRAVA